MSFTAFTNIITILFCLAVLVQSLRMMRSLDRVRESQLDRTVAALDTATAKARSVLSELKETLTTEGTAHARSLGDAREVREELNVMVGIANAMAERLIEAASATSQAGAQPDAKSAASPAKAAPARRAGAPTKRSTPKKATPTKAAAPAKAARPAKTAKPVKSAKTATPAKAPKTTPAKTAKATVSATRKPKAAATRQRAGSPASKPAKAKTDVKETA